MPDHKASAATTPNTWDDCRVVYVVDDDESMRQALESLLRSMDLEVHTFASTEEFLAAPRSAKPSCLVLDVRLRGQSGIAFQTSLVESGEPHMPIIFMSGHGDIAMTVKAMKAGALDFLPKPFRDQDMIDAVMAALEFDASRLETDRALLGLRARWASLTPREREVLRHVASGLMNKHIAAAMGIAEITTKIHRGQGMRKLNCRSVADLVRMLEALGAGFE